MGIFIGGNEFILLHRLPLRAIENRDKMKMKFYKWIDEISVKLKIKKPFIWTPTEFENKLLEKAYLKIFNPTIDSFNKFNGDFQIELSYTDLDSNKHIEYFNVSLFFDEIPGIKFKITLPKNLNIGSVKYKESYGLSNELSLSNGKETYIVPQDSIKDFETNFPSLPQILEGRFTRIKSSNQNFSESYCRAIISIKDKEMIFPTSILDYGENHMKFDITSWDRQMTLLDIPFLTTRGMFSELKIKGINFHFYGMEQLKALLIDSIDQIKYEHFKKVTYSIRLCFAFLSGKFYRDEIAYFKSDDSDFSKIKFIEYQTEEPSIITDNQLINPTFFFTQYERQSKEIKEKWKDFHKMFNTKFFSLMCEKVLDSTEFARSLELVINAGNINDPVQKGALYSVCIETLTELIQDENEESFKPIPKDKKKLWEELRKQFKSSLKIINDDISINGYSILLKKIDNLNSPTNRDKLEKAFKIVGIDLSESELDSLNHRNNYLHGGQPDDEARVLNSNLNALKLHNLIGRLILKYFGYTGHYINIAGWYILNDRESMKILERIDINELKELMLRIEKKEFESTEQSERAKQTLLEFEKFIIAALEIEELIKII